MKTILFGAMCLALLPVMNSVAETRFASGPQQTALVELYTSEGCSSCPPAEAWLSRLKGSTGLWQQFVPLAFHVDYWNYLGWRDRFSAPQWTERQRNYGSLWQSSSVYTPAVAINGQEVRSWSGRNPAQPNDKKTGRLTAQTKDGKTFHIDFKPETGPASGWQAHLALLASGITSKIGGGENGGRNLPHDFIVLALHDGAMQEAGGTAQASLTIDAKSEPGARQAVAIWITRAGEISPVQATGGWLP